MNPALLPIAVLLSTLQTVPPTVRISPSDAGPQGSSAKPQRPAESAKPPAPPAVETLRLAFKISLTANAFRIAVLDPNGTQKPVLAVLSPAAVGGSRLEVMHWDGAAFVQEWAVDLPEKGALLAAGSFGTDGSGYIVTEQSVIRKTEEGWQRRTLSRPEQPVGQVRMTDGSEALLLRSSRDFAVARVDFGAAESPLVRLDPAKTAATLNPASLRHGVLHSPVTELAAVLPPEFAVCGVMGFWDWRRNGKSARVVVRYAPPKPMETPPSAPASDPSAPKPAPQDTGSNVLLAESISADGIQEIWRSSPLEGRIADICIGDPRGDRTETMLVLSMDARGGRVLYGFSVPPMPAPAGSVKPTPTGRAAKP
jgi:hypothetical protein